MSGLDQVLDEARRLRSQARYADAELTTQRGLDTAPPGDLRRLLMAELAHLLYYRGRFGEGVTLASEALNGPAGLASGRAALAASVNLIALNRGTEALHLVQRADLDLRTAAAEEDDRLEVLVQQAHVEAHMGRHGSAVRTARAAVHLAERGNLARERIARARYVLGFALSYAGEEDAIAHLLAAEALARDRALSLRQWILFCIAVHLRDLGWHAGASDFLARSNVALRHERAWFAYRMGDTREALAWLRAPIASDERPYLRVVVAAIRRDRRRPGHLSAMRAAEEFRRGGLDHWRWAAEWLALLPYSARDATQTHRLSLLVDELAAREIRRWGFYHPPIALAVLNSAPAPIRTYPYVRDLIRLLDRDGAEPAANEASVLMRALGILQPEALPTLRSDMGLSTAEIRTLTAAIDRWLRMGETPRALLASDLGIGETSVRSHLTGIRSKLGIPSDRRGVEPLISWLANRSLLAPETALRAVRVMTDSAGGAPGANKRASRSRRPANPRSSP